MASDDEFSDAMKSFARRENLPAELDSEDWSTVPREIRERAFFMSKVTDAEILDRFRRAADEFVAGKKTRNTLDKELSTWLEQKGYKPAEGKAGGLEDLSSLRRISVVLNTNLDMARGHARWLRMQKTLVLFPALELVRLAERDEKRPWPSRWKTAMEKLGTATAAVMVETGGGTADDPISKWTLAAPVNDPIWEEISIFNQPYPPFDWGSGVGVKPLPRAKAKALGVLPEKGSPAMEPQQRSMNEALTVTPDLRSAEAKAELAKKLGRFGEWDGEKLVFTDPDGTRPHTAKRLAEIWKKPAPEGFDHLSQRDALDAWDGGATPDPTDLRVTLRRLFDRVQNDLSDPLPETLHRSFPLDAESARELVAVLKARTIRVPGDFAGWEWGTALNAGRPAEKGWLVVMSVKGVTLAKDLRALRPGKPGFVYVGGKVFRVTDFKQDVRARRIVIELEEGEQP